MMKIVLFLLCVTIFGCSPQNGKLKVDKSNAPELFKMSDFKGIWSKNVNENAVFEISNDTMYLLEGKPVRFEVHQDTLITYYDGMTTRDRILKLTTDSLILVNEFGSIISLFKKK